MSTVRIINNLSVTLQGNEVAAKQGLAADGFSDEYGILAAANTTPISGSAPTMTDIDSIVLQNNSGTSMNYVVRIID